MKSQGADAIRWVADTLGIDSRVNDLRYYATAYEMMEKAVALIVEAHENVDSGADIPAHVYKEAKAALDKARA